MVKKAASCCFGVRLRQARERLGLPQDKLGVMIGLDEGCSSARISRYETGGLPAGPANYFNLVFRRARMEGFIVLDWAAEFPAIRDRLRGLIDAGRLTWQEDVQQGFEQAPATLQRLFNGSNRGKQLLRLD